MLAAALDACRATLAGTAEQDSWDTASIVRDDNPANLDCLDAMAFALLSSLVDAHRKNPDLPFEFRDTGTRGRPNCLVVISRDPAQANPGDVVEVTGHNLQLAEAVLIDGDSQRAAKIVQKSSNRLRFQIPTNLTTNGYNVVITWHDRSNNASAWVPLQVNTNSHPDPTTAPTESTAAPTSEQPNPPAPFTGNHGGGTTQTPEKPPSPPATGAAEGQ